MSLNQADIPPEVNNQNGYAIPLGKELGRGGEGSIYRLVNRTDQVAKIYHKPISDQRADKLRAMIQYVDEPLLKIAAWPVELLWHNHKICGFIMPRISGFKEIHMLYGPAHRRREFPGADWQFLVQAARNVASAFAVIHSRGHAVGDVNPSNILVDEQAQVRLIDCDSMQIRHFNTIHTCDVGVLQFTPPELQGKIFRGLERLANHDNFGLALLVFHLLFMGRHPYAGRYTGDDSTDMPIDRAIAEHRFPYGEKHANYDIQPPPHTLSLMESGLSPLFEVAFGELHQRPKARDWMEALDVMLVNLTRCDHNRLHRYYQKLSYCPWCRLERAAGTLFFIDKISDEDLNQDFDLERAWSRIMAVKPPGLAPTIVPSKASFTAKPVRETGPMLRFVKAYKPLVPALIFVIAMLVTGGDNIVVWLMLSFLAWAITQLIGDNVGDLHHRQSMLELAESDWGSVHFNWEQEAGDVAFNDRLADLRRVRLEYEQLVSQCQQQFAGPTLNLENAQRKRYLEKQFISQEPIPNVGSNLKSLLASFGIETAADITRAKLAQVPGFGPSRIKSLEDWKKEKLNAFQFNPEVDKQEVALQDLNLEYQNRMMPLARRLANGPSELQKVRVQILENRERLKVATQETLDKLEQARVDLTLIESKTRQ